MFKTTVFAVACAALCALPAWADGIMVKDAYARSASPAAKTGAIFMVLENHGAAGDQLIAAATDAAQRVELHTHIAGDGGVMQMREVEGGFAIPAHGQHALARGGDHVMLMGLTGPLAHGDTVALTLTFENAGDVVVEVPVDLHRKADAAAHGVHDAHDAHAGHGDSDHDDHTSHKKHDH